MVEFRKNRWESNTLQNNKKVINNYRNWKHMLEMLWKIDSNRLLAAWKPKLKPEGLRKVCASRAPNSQTRRNIDQQMIRMWLKCTNNNIETNETHRQMIKGCHEEIETAKSWKRAQIVHSLAARKPKLQPEGLRKVCASRAPNSQTRWNINQKY